MTDAQIRRLRKATEGRVVGGTQDRAWRALCRAGLVRAVGRGPSSYTALYDATDAGRAELQRRAQVPA